MVGQRLAETSKDWWRLTETGSGVIRAVVVVVVLSWYGCSGVGVVF